MHTAQKILDLYIEEYLKNNPSENEADLRKRLNDALEDKSNKRETDACAPLSTENEQPAKEKSYTLEEVRLRHKGAYMPWTDELDTELTMMFIEGETQKEMAKHFGRTSGAISSRIKKLDLND